MDLVVVGPEAPLVAGLADELPRSRCFGPLAAAARLEGSKAYAKEVMAAAGVPTAAYAVVDSVEAGLAAIAGYPTVIKADGLAAGKGVVIAADEARGARGARGDARRAPLRRHPGRGRGVPRRRRALAAGALRRRDARSRWPRRATTSGSATATPARTRAGWAAYSPVPEIDDAMVERIRADVHQPVVDELARRGTPFHGVLYAGLMLDRRRPAGARVQRPLRRSRDAGRAPAAALATCSTCCSARRARAGSPASTLEWDAAHAR